MRKVLIGIGLFGLLMSSCVHRLTDFTVISTRNVPLGISDAVLHKADKRVKAEDKIPIVLGIPIGSPNMKEAIDKAIEQYPGAIGLADGVIKSKSFWALLYGEQGYVVEGTPLYEVNDNEEDGYNTTPVHRTKQHSGFNTTKQSNEDTGTGLLFFHEVKQGETLKTIANSYGVTMSEIIKWNKLSSSNVEKGDKLRIIVR